MIRWYFFEQNHSSSDLIFICKLKLPFAKVVFCFWKKPIWDSCCVNHVMLSCAHNLTDSRHTKSLTSETQKSSPTKLKVFIGKWENYIVISVNHDVRIDKKSPNEFALKTGIE